MRRRTKPARAKLGPVLLVPPLDWEAFGLDPYPQVGGQEKESCINGPREDSDGTEKTRVQKG